MNGDRNKPGVAFWATVVVVGLPLLYVLSFGPACWLAIRRPSLAAIVGRAYSPLTRLAWLCPGRTGIAPLRNYALWGQPSDPLTEGEGPSCSELVVADIILVGRPGR
jgi:hypothetical protein